MPVTEKKYPDWVQKYRTRGTTVKKVGDSYYLYKRTSRRVPGKKYPQPVDTYIGVITPNGVTPRGRKLVTLGSVEVKEYGFSRAVWELCPEGWKKTLGDRWEDVLTAVIAGRSAKSYLVKERKLLTAEELHCQFAAQTAALSRRLYKEHGVSLDDLQPLDDIYLVYFGKETVVSKISDAQKDLLDRLGIRLEVS